MNNSTDLVVINSQEEQQFIQSEFDKYHTQYWLEISCIKIYVPVQHHHDKDASYRWFTETFISILILYNVLY